MDFKIRLARKEDCKDVSRMIRDLAVFENVLDQVKISHEELERDGFCRNPLFECLIAEVPEEQKSKDGFTVVGYAFYFYSYSAWKGRSMYLDDLYVMPDFRGHGIGKRLLSKVIETGKQKQCVRLQLSVMDWNTAARELYATMGGVDVTESEGRHLVRFEQLNMDKLAKGASKE